MTKVGLISDTHDNLEKTKKAIEVFEQENCEIVIHCGDMVAPFTAKLFDRDFDFYAVRGNNDGEWNLKETVEEFGDFYNNIAELDFSGKKIVFYHGTEEEIVDALVKSGNYDYVFRGHTHRKKMEDINGTIEINPGGINLPDQDEKLHIVTLDISSGETEFHRIER